MLSIEQIIELRNKQIERIRKAQRTLAIIDATITSDPRYRTQLENWDGNVATEIPALEQAVAPEQNAMFN